MTWGTFGIVHILSLVAGAALVAALYFLLRKRSVKVQMWVLGVLSFSGVAAIIYNLLMWDSPLEYLPLHLCSLNALVLPIAVLTRNKTLSNLLLVWSLGAVAALVLNYDVADAVLFGDVFCFFYFPHVLEFGIPILLFSLGLVKKDPKCIGSTLVITMASYTVVHLINKLINSLEIMNGDTVLQVNYMFSIEPTNPLTALFYQVIPYEYWHMYMVLPIVLVYLLAVYAPQLLKKKQTA